ncbi:MAG: Nif3-like dinuclear metal center hexameric protein [Bacteroidales bacterium]|nr:Nif3-like dinuclear metal center hexameric protein [Bacteroidales bacterium]
MKISEIAKCIETIAPLNIQESWDNCGLLVGHPDDDVSKILLCLDITEDVLQEAISEKCDLIISHHPMIFFGLKKIYTNSLVYKAIQNKIAVYCAHTNIDSAHFGVSTILGEKLGLKNLRALKKNAVDENYGMGVVGEFETALSELVFLDLVKKTCQIPFVKHSRLSGKPIKTVALCGGGGSELREDAIAQNADTYVSSDFKHFEYHTINTPLLLVDAGHFETEQFAVDILYSEISKNFPNLVIVKTKTNNNPVFYR